MTVPGRGDLFIVSSPSGGGKTTLIRRLLEVPPGEPLHFSVSHTTRPMRKGEQEGREYHFVTAETFQRMVQRDEFLEHNE
ncbi:MAG TPA: guanylate kinase, partial [Thermoanaerobaculia bacterium]|nr:guanylate kinase [Thermoanaerobaculia bacterium]